MKIALLGYGKMGKMIEEIALQRGHSIVCKSSSKKQDSLIDADVCIDFSHPECAFENLKKAAEAKKPIVIGTTGWYDKLSKAEEIVKDSHIGILYSPNFSIGVHLFLQILKQAGQLLNGFNQYDVGITEAHHNQKADSPSGTAKLICQTLLDQITRKDNIDISSLRCGSIPGEHSVIFDSEVDQIILSHKALNRKGFALGAVIAAEWLMGKKGVFTMDDLLGEK